MSPKGLSFLLEGKVLQNIEPKFIVNFDSDSEGNLVDAKIDEQMFRSVISRSKNRPMLFVDALGMPQQGKTTMIKILTRNTAHESGNGRDEQTKGITIDGPYEIEELIKGYGLKPTIDLGRAAPHVYFLDIEGYGGFCRGRNYDDAKRIYQKFAVPFCGISGVHVVFISQNEGLHSLATIEDTLNLPALCSGADALSSSKIIFGVKDVQRMAMDVDFTHPDRRSSDLIGEKLKALYKSINFLSNVNYIVRPLPHIDPTNATESEIVPFKPAYDLFIEDIFKLIECAAQTSHVRDFESTIQHFTEIKNALNNMSEMKNVFSNSLMNQGEKTIQRQIELAIAEASNIAKNSLDEAFNEALSSKKRDLLNDRIVEIQKQLLADVASFLPPGLRNSDALVEPKQKLVEQFDKLCSQKNSRLLSELAPRCLVKASSFASQEILREREQLKQQLEKREFLANTLKNKSSVIDSIMATVMNATKAFIGKNLSEQDKSLQDPINAVLETLQTTLVSEINNEIDLAVLKHTSQSSSFVYEEDPTDNKYTNVYQIIKKEDPTGKVVEEREFVCRVLGKEKDGILEKLGRLAWKLLPVVAPLAIKYLSLL